MHMCYHCKRRYREQHSKGWHIRWYGDDITENRKVAWAMLTLNGLFDSRVLRHTFIWCLLPYGKREGFAISRWFEYRMDKVGKEIRVEQCSLLPASWRQILIIQSRKGAFDFTIGPSQSRFGGDASPRKRWEQQRTTISMTIFWGACLWVQC